MGITLFRKCHLSTDVLADFCSNFPMLRFDVCFETTIIPECSRFSVASSHDTLMILNILFITKILPVN